MSKSKGNVITPDEVIHGVYQLDPNYEFRNVNGEVINYKSYGVWRDCDGDYFTSKRTGHQPVFYTKKIILYHVY